MSSDGIQPTLSGFQNVQREADARGWTPDESNVCLSCGASIDEQVARVVGDNDGNVPQCERCASARNGKVFESTTMAVVKARARRARR